MPTRMSCSAILILLGLAPISVGHAAEMPIDCRLKGGTVVQLPEEACRLEGGTRVIETAAPVPLVISPASGVMPETASGNTSAGQSQTNSRLEEAQKLIVSLLGKTVESATPLTRNPEVIERSAKFDGCRLIVDGQLHIEYGNAYSVWRDFKINSVIDFSRVEREEIGILEKVSSKGGELTGAAVYFEERKNKNGNNISISVQYLRNGSYIKYTIHGPSSYFETPGEDLWIEDEYGYTKDTGLNTAAIDRVRILYIVKSLDEATKLKNAFEEVNTTCKSQK